MCLWVLLCLTVARRWPHFLNSYQSWCTFLIILPVLLPCLFFMFVFLATLTDFCFVFTRWYIDICLTFVLLLFENHLSARLLAFLCSFFSLGPSSAYRFSPRNIHFLLPLLQLLCFVSTSYEIFTGSIQHCYIFHRLFCLSVYRAVSVCKCVPNLLISVFVFVFSVFVLHFFCIV